jgi:hypothetical protein
LQKIVSAEGNETPGSGPGASHFGGPDPEGPGRGGEGDLLAERRARRAAESGEHALAHRAETAEATVRTLEAHVASLQQRLREAAEERLRLSELIEAERSSPTSAMRASTAGEQGMSPVGELERELRHAKQREYSEQQLRIEAEARCAALERETRAEIEHLRRRLTESERDARAVDVRMQSLREELSEAERAAAAERGEMRRVERELQVRLTELERRAFEIDRGLDAERAARERAERMLESMRRGQRKVEGMIAELRGLVARFKQVALAPVAPAAGASRARATHVSDPAQPAPSGPVAPAHADRAEMADALAAAVERLRARADEQPEQAVERSVESVARPDLPAAEPEQSAAGTAPAAPSIERPTHKHSMSLIRRWRLALKRRREQRAQRRLERARER